MRLNQYGAILLYILVTAPTIDIIRMFLFKARNKIIIKNHSYTKYYFFVIPFIQLIMIIYVREFTTLYSRSILLFYLLILISYIIQSFSDIGIVETGIYSGREILKWNQIESYKWINKKPRKNSKYYVLRIIKPNKIMYNLVIKKEDRNIVENIFNQNEIRKMISF